MRYGVDFLEESARRYTLQYLKITQKFTATTRSRKVGGPASLFHLAK